MCPLLTTSARISGKEKKVGERALLACLYTNTGDHGAFSNKIARCSYYYRTGNSELTFRVQLFKTNILLKFQMF